MSKINEQALLQQISEQACRFIYKNYFLDEVSNGKDTLMYLSHVLPDEMWTIAPPL